MLLIDLEKKIAKCYVKSILQSPILQNLFLASVKITSENCAFSVDINVHWQRGKVWVHDVNCIWSTLKMNRLVRWLRPVWYLCYYLLSLLQSAQCNLLRVLKARRSLSPLDSTAVVRCSPPSRLAGKWLERGQCVLQRSPAWHSSWQRLLLHYSALNEAIYARGKKKGKGNPLWNELL